MGPFALVWVLKGIFQVVFEIRDLNVNDGVGRKERLQPNVSTCNQSITVCGSLDAKTDEFVQEFVECLKGAGSTGTFQSYSKA